MTTTERAERLVEQAKREPYYSELEAEVARLLDVLREARQELYDLCHSSGDPADPLNMECTAVTYRRIVAAIDATEAAK